MAKKVTVNKEYGLIPVKVLDEGFSNAFKGDILGVGPVDYVKLSAAGKVEKVPFPDGAETVDVYVEGDQIVAAPAAEQKSTPVK